MSKNRDDFDEKTKTIARRRVNGICSNPDCKIPTQGPSSTLDNGIEFIGEVAHICAASKDGPRYDEDQTTEDRKSINNALFLCSNCAEKIDKNMGIDYPKELLYSWKQDAEKEAKLNFGKSFKNKGWDIISFDNLETDYASALTCVGMTQKNVISCPRFEETINDVKKYLKTNSNCCLYGVSGSGKSLTAYQIAYDYYNDGFEILKLKNNYDNDCINIPQKDKLFLLIDNAHYLSDELVLDICSKTNKNIVALFVASNEIYKVKNELNELNIEQIINPIDSLVLPCVEFNLEKAITTLKTFCIEHSKELLPIVSQFDSHIGDDYLDTPIQHRIEYAANQPQNTPWLFNYALIGGWQKAKTDVLNIRKHNRADFLLFIIAIVQIFTLDKGLNLKLLEELSKFYTNDLNWFKDSIKILNKKNMLLFENTLIKLKHIEYAKRIIASFEDEKDSKLQNAILKLLDYFISQFDKKREVFSLLNVLEFNCRNKLHYYFYKYNEKLSSLLKTCLNKEEYSEYNIYLVDFILNFQWTDEEKTPLFEILISNSDIVLFWVETYSLKTAYSLDRLINTFINVRETFPMRFLVFSTELAKKLADDISQFPLSRELHSLVHFVDRLMFFTTKSWNQTFLDNLKDDKIKINNFNDLYIYFEYLKIFGRSSENLIYKNIEKNLDDITSLFNKDHTIAYRFEVHILFYSYFKHDCIENAKILEKFINNLNETDIAKKINSITKRELEHSGGFLFFIKDLDKAKFNNIIKLIDFDYLNNFIDYKDLKNSHSIITFFTIVSYSNYGKKKIKRLFEDNLKNASYFNQKTCKIIPELVIKKSQSSPSTKVNLEMSVISWKEVLKILKSLYKIDKEETIKIIFNNKSDIQNAIYLSQNTGLEGCCQFLEFIEKIVPNVNELLFDGIDIDKAEKHWKERLKGKKNEKVAVNMLINMAKKSKYSFTRLANLR